MKLLSVQVLGKSSKSFLVLLYSACVLAFENMQCCVMPCDLVTLFTSKL